MNTKKDITGIILAGGKSSRMGSDKGFVDLNGSSFMARIIRVIKPLVNEIIIVSNSTDYDVFKLKRVEDIVKNAGPIAGLYTGLYHSETENNLVLSCDVPLINTAVLNKLIEKNDKESDIVQIQSHGKTMPLIAIYKKRCAPLFMQLLTGGERKLRTLALHMKTKTIDLDARLDQYTRNINTISELNELRHELEN